jgi:mannose-1-phosphate guanylyltransferase/mannose-6-phosphate isomerase
MKQTIIPVVMCGGAGTRLWPASRETMPKQFIALVGEKSTFQETMQRIVVDDLFERPIVITSSEFRFVVADQLQQIGIQADIVLEPFRRDSGPAVATAAVLGLQRSADATMLILASDHAVAKVDAFHDACRDALPVASNGYIVTFGIVPTEPATGYGYLKLGEPFPGSKASKLAAFAEKPDRAKAEAYLKEGHLWNSGNFLFRAELMKQEMLRLQPEMWKATESAVLEARADLDFLRLAEGPFGQAPKISIDYAIMESTTHSAVLPVDLGWSDLGSWDAVWAHSAKDGDGNALSGPCEVYDVRNTIVRSDPTVVTTVIGLSDVVVVSSGDAVLVAPRTVTEDIKKLLEKMKQVGRPEATEHLRSYRPWGFYDRLNRGDRHLVKRIVVNPGQQLSLQKHHHRSEHWVVVRGTGEVIIGNEVRSLHENESTFIPLGAMHRIKNPGHIPLELIEVAVGSYLEEDDIVRIEDMYNRSTTSN